MALLEPGGFGHNASVHSILRGFLEFRETLFDALVLTAISDGSLAGCGRTRWYCAVKSYSGSSIARVQPQCGAQFGGLLFELLGRQPADECRIAFLPFTTLTATRWP